MEGIDVLPDGGGYIWPLMKATLLMLTAERLEVMMGCPPRFVIPAPDTIDDVYSTFATLTDDRVLKLPMGDVIGAIPVLLSPPFTKTVEAYMVEGVAPVIPDWGGYDWPLMNDTKRFCTELVLILPMSAVRLLMYPRCLQLKVCGFSMIAAVNTFDVVRVPEKVALVAVIALLNWAPPTNKALPNEFILEVAVR